LSEFTGFLPPELADLGLMALADPGFAERLVESLRRLPPAAAVDEGPGGAPAMNEVLELAACP
jgi:hypothetical protein